jgi:dsDNA-specific endonuclease/ATPase MutS2
MDQQHEKPMRQVLSDTDAAIQQDQTRIADALKIMAKEVNSRQPPRHHNEGLPHFVKLSRSLGEALIEIAQQQVNAAENHLIETKQWVENMQREAQEKWEEMQKLERKFEDYRSYVLQANDRFNGDKK